MLDSARELLPAAPPAAVGGGMLAGIHFNDVVLAVTLLYTVVQLIISLPKLYKVLKDLFNGKDTGK